MQKRFRNVSHLIYPFVLIVLLNTQGCAVQRNMVFPPIEPLPRQISENTAIVSIHDFNFSLQSSHESSFKYDKKALEDSFRQQLEQHLFDAGLKPVSDNSGMYDLRGTVIVKEKIKINGLIVPAIIVGILTFPFTGLTMALFPINDYYYDAEANVTLVDMSSRSVLLEKQFKNDVVKITPVIGDYDMRNPKSRVNTTFMKAADDVLTQCVGQVADKIHYLRKQSGAAMLNSAPPTSQTSR